MNKLIYLFLPLFFAELTFASGINKPVSSQSAYISKSNEIAGRYGFIENKGQIIDQNNQLNPSVLYLYNGNTLHVQLKQTGFSYEVIKTEAKPKLKSETEINLPSKFAHDSLDYTFHFHRIDISFVGANQNVKISASDAAPDYINYYTTGTSEAGVTNVHHYKKVLYQNIYNNIDVEFDLTPNPSPEEMGAATREGNSSPSGRLGGVKYNFIVHPGGNPNDIQMKFGGANSTSLTSDGHITIETAYGNIDESIPLSYQLNESNSKQSVNAMFSQGTTNIYGIAVGKYDETKTLVIDPAPWATYFGGSNNDYADGIVTDGNGGLLVTGRTNSTNNISTLGVHQAIINGSFDAFVVKFNSSGTRQWATYYGGIDNDAGTAIATDRNQNILVTGYTYSIVGISTVGAHQTTNGGGSKDAFIVKFTSSGVRQWGTYYGGSYEDRGFGIACDSVGNIIVTGWTGSANDISSTSAHQTTIGGTFDAFILKFNPSGVRQWATYYGGIGEETSNCITTDRRGDIIVAGWTCSVNSISTPGTHQATHGGGDYDAFIVKFNTLGVRQWGTYYGGSDKDAIDGIAIDVSGRILVTGGTSSTNAISTIGTYQTSYGGDRTTYDFGDAFIATFNGLGVRQWATYYGGSGDDCGYSIAIDGSGNTLITGKTNSTNAISTIGAYQTIYSGSSHYTDAFIAKFNSAGMRQWATYFGDTLDDCGNGIALDGNENVKVAGYTQSSSALSTAGAHQTVYGGGVYDAFVASFTSNGGLQPIYSNTIAGSQNICPGSTPTTIQGSTPTGGIGTYQYLWLSSVNSSFGFVPASGTNTGINYTPSPSSINKWYKRLVISGGVNDTSTAVAIIVDRNVGFTINNPNQCFLGNNFLFTDTSNIHSGLASRKWKFGTGLLDTSSLSSPSKTFSSSGVYQISLVIIDSLGCRDSIIKNISTGSKPISGFTINNISQCINLNNFIFTDTSKVAGGVLTRLWNFGDGSEDTLVNTNKQYLNKGDFNVKLIVNSFGCKDSITQTVTVNPKPNPGFTINKTAQCLTGNNFLFNDTSKISSGTITRNWNFGNGISDTSILLSPTKTYGTANSYQVKLVSVSNNNCRDSITKNVTVYSQPKAGFNQSNLIQCLIGNSFSFDDTTANANTRLWNLGDLTTNTNDTFSKSYTVAGTYNVKLKITDVNACSDSIIKVVTVKPNPAKPIITALSSSQLQSTVASSYQWYLNNNPLSGSIAQILTLTTNGTYHVKIDSTNACSNLSNPFIATKVGIEEVFRNNEIKIYPNPSTGMLSINSGNTITAVIKVFDVNGKLVLESSNNKSQNEMQLDLSSCSEGVYSIHLQNENGEVYKTKIVLVKQ